MKKKPAIMCFLGIFLIFNAEAFMISFMVIETGLSEGEHKQHSYNWENTLMDVFFDEGYIVSNSSMLSLAEKPLLKMDNFIIREVNEAKEGGADFLIVTLLDYMSKSDTPDEVSIYVYKINPYTNIFERQIAGRIYRTEREEIEDIKIIIRGLVPRLRT